MGSSAKCDTLLFVGDRKQLKAVGELLKEDYEDDFDEYKRVCHIVRTPSGKIDYNRSTDENVLVKKSHFPYKIRLISDDSAKDKLYGLYISSKKANQRYDSIVNKRFYSSYLDLILENCLPFFTNDIELDKVFLPGEKYPIFYKPILKCQLPSNMKGNTNWNGIFDSDKRMPDKIRKFFSKLCDITNEEYLLQYDEDSNSLIVLYNNKKGTAFNDLQKHHNAIVAVLRKLIDMRDTPFSELEFYDKNGNISGNFIDMLKYVISSVDDKKTYKNIDRAFVINSILFYAYAKSNSDNFDDITSRYDVRIMVDDHDLTRYDKDYKCFMGKVTRIKNDHLDRSLGFSSFVSSEDGEDTISVITTFYDGNKIFGFKDYYVTIDDVILHFNNMSSTFELFNIPDDTFIKRYDPATYVSNLLKSRRCFKQVDNLEISDDKAKKIRVRLNNAKKKGIYDLKINLDV